MSDATHCAVHQMIGKGGIVDLCGIRGYSSMLAMMMNVDRTGLPEGATAPLPNIWTVTAG